jgi:hypothetical protein
MMEIENTTDSTVTVEGHRGVLPPRVVASDGTTVGVSSIRPSLENGGGGWGLLAKTPYLSPGGRALVTYGLRADDGRAVSELLPLVITWTPVGTQPATFEVR